MLADVAPADVSLLGAMPVDGVFVVILVVVLFILVVVLFILVDVLFIPVDMLFMTIPVDMLFMTIPVISTEFLCRSGASSGKPPSDTGTRCSPRERCDSATPTRSRAELATTECPCA